MENYRRRLVAAALALTLIGNGAGVLTGCSNKSDAKTTVNTVEKMPEDTKKEKIKEYYGENSLENDVIAYLELAKKLDTYDLKRITDYTNWNPTDLLSPEEIEYIIMAYDRTLNDEYSEYEKNTIELSLSTQKQLIRNYLLKEGLNIVYGDYSNALKDYIIKSYNLIDCSELKLYKVENSSDASISYMGKYRKFDSPYEFKFYINRSDIDSKEGIEYMITLQNVIALSSEELEELYINALAAAVEYNNKTNVKNSGYTKQG